MQLLYQPEWHPGTPMTQQKGALMHAPQLQADVRAHGAASAPAAHAHAAATPVPSPHAFTSASLRSVPLRAAAAAAWPNAKLLPSPVVRVCNYPPSDLSSFAAQAAGQQFYWSPVAWQIGLHENCSLLHTRVGCSGVLPAGRAGLGLFAGRAFAEGATIGYMWGRFATQEEWDSICHGGVELYPYHSARLGEMAENFVAPVQNGIHRCVAVPYQEHGATLLLASEQCPMAYMNHGDTAAARNVRIAVPATAFSWRDQPAYQYVPCIVRTSHGRGIAAGDELLTNYEWTTADLNRLTARFAKQHDTRSIVLAQYAAHTHTHTHTHTQQHRGAVADQHSSCGSSSRLIVRVSCPRVVCRVEASKFVGPPSPLAPPTRSGTLALLVPLSLRLLSARVGRTSKPAVAAPHRQLLAARVSQIRPL